MAGSGETLLLPQPTFYPDGGQCAPDSSVHLTLKNDQGMHILYTTDYTVPDKDKLGGATLRYTKPIMLRDFRGGEILIRAISVTDDGKLSSPQVARAFHISCDAPSANGTPLGPGTPDVRPVLFSSSSSTLAPTATSTSTTSSDACSVITRESAEPAVSTKDDVASSIPSPRLLPAPATSFLESPLDKPTKPPPTTFSRSTSGGRQPSSSLSTPPSSTMIPNLPSPDLAPACATNTTGHIPPDATNHPQWKHHKDPNRGFSSRPPRLSPVQDNDRSRRELPVETEVTSLDYLEQVMERRRDPDDQEFKLKEHFMNSKPGRTEADWEMAEVESPDGQPQYVCDRCGRSWNVLMRMQKHKEFCSGPTRTHSRSPSRHVHWSRSHSQGSQGGDTQSANSESRISGRPLSRRSVDTKSHDSAGGVSSVSGMSGPFRNANSFGRTRSIEESSVSGASGHGGVSPGLHPTASRRSKTTEDRDGPRFASPPGSTHSSVTRISSLSNPMPNTVSPHRKPLAQPKDMTSCPYCDKKMNSSALAKHKPICSEEPSVKKQRQIDMQNRKHAREMQRRANVERQSGVSPEYARNEVLRSPLSQPSKTPPTRSMGRLSQPPPANTSFNSKGTSSLRAYCPKDGVDLETVSNGSSPLQPITPSEELMRQRDERKRRGRLPSPQFNQSAPTIGGFSPRLENHSLGSTWAPRTTDPDPPG
eukprot:Sspe_Gene.9134::Locus_3074_Transcript_1_1_Confidence_1.000_Length_2267::g.9134::m.9134